MPTGILGFFLLLLLELDIVKTSLSLKGSGPLAGWLTGIIWSLALRLHRQRPNHQLLSYAGATTMVATIGLWLLLLWLGWTLVFWSTDASVVNTSTGASANAFETAYFVGYSLLTLGSGEYQPNGPLWQAFTVLMSASGSLTITLTVTYLLSVLPAVATKRQTASYIASLGMMPQALIKRHLSGSAPGGLASHGSHLLSNFKKLHQQYGAYPILHYFHTPEPRDALALRLSALYEALIYLKDVSGADEERLRPLRPLEEAVEELINSLTRDIDLTRTPEPPRLPVERLRQHGPPLKKRGVAEGSMDERAIQRKKLYYLVRRDGWAWEDVFNTNGR